MIIWNPWHGCHKVSEGCEHCYMYFLDSQRGLDTSHVFRTENFTLPIQRRRDGQFKLPSGMTLHVGLSTDFFVEEADQWRDEAWRIIRQRPDIFFRLLTKRPERFADCLPKDWDDGYDNVMLPFFRPHCATCGSHMTCNGCSNCGACDKNKSIQQVEIQV